MTEPAAAATEQGPERGPPRPAEQGIGRAAALIAALTVLARVIGLVRQLVFAHTVGSVCLGTAYTTANLVPNVIYDIVLGGVLTGIMVPLLARPAQQAAPSQDGAGEASRISSALLTWTVAILLPASVIITLAAGPVISLLVPGTLNGCARAEVVSVGGRMLAVFAPQILLYGLAVVLYGILQAHRKFTAPALAPVLSSLVVIAAYVVFATGSGRLHTAQLAGLSTAAALTLSVGTTAGVAALVVTAMVPAWRLRLRLRPSFRFPEGVARRARGLAAVGVAAVLAQDASVLVVTWLANGHGSTGAVVLYNYGWQVFTAAYSVLAISIVVSAFPTLAAREGEQFNDVAAVSTRAVLLMSWLGAAVLAGFAVPAARVFAVRVHGLSAAAAGHQAGELALAFAAFAPGLVGYGVVACLFRVLLADGRNRIAATVVPAGWLLVIAADVIAVPLVSRSAVVPVLALVNTVGMTVTGIALLIAVRRVRGPAALRGIPRAFMAGLAGALAGAAVGAAVSASIHVSGVLLNGGLALLSAGCALSVFGAVAYRLDGGDMRAVLARVRKRAMP